MTSILLHTGSNMGDRLANLAAARQRTEAALGRLLRASGIYQTAAWGLEGQPDFYNQALLLETPRAPMEVLDAILGIETALGRVRELRWGSRSIDIDLLFYGQDIIDLPRLQVPHPLLHQRRFVLAPVAEIAPQWQHPVLLQDMQQLLAASQDPLPVTRLDDGQPT